MSVCSLICAAVLLTSGAAAAEPPPPALAEARAALEARDFRRTFDLYSALVDTPARGEALFFLSRVYRYGLGVVPADPEKGLDLLHRAVDAGHTPAMSHLAMMLYSGDDVPEDHEAARRLYRRAADLGDANAAYGLGWVLRWTEDRPAEGAPWLRRAADAGVVDAMNDLGDMYRLGIGVERAPIEAMALYRRAAVAGNGEARRKLVVMYAGGEGVPADLVRAEAWGLLADLDHDPVSPAVQRFVGGPLTPEQKAEAARLANACRADPTACP